MSKFAVFALAGICFLAVSAMPAHAGIAPHTHTHEKHASKERFKDGAFVRHDAQHAAHDENNAAAFSHEAILGSVKDAEDFDTLPPEESKKRLLALLKLMDLNNDMYIERQELKAWILRSLKKLSEEEAADRFEEIVDKQDDDKLTWPEYLEDAYSFREDENGNQLSEFDLDEEDSMMMAADRDMFNAADLNKDGALDRTEFSMFHTPEEHPEMLPLVLQHTMLAKDKDGNGMIDFQEFIADGAREQDKEWLISEKTRFDAEFDQNQDGFLSGNEVINWVVPSNDRTANEEVDHLFASTDADHDDRLSFLEILNNYETFVGSEVTDYGDQLRNVDTLKDEL